MCAQGTHHQTIQLSFNGSQTVRWSTLKLATFEFVQALNTHGIRSKYLYTPHRILMFR